MNVLFLAAECAPFVKVGGLGDVVGTLPQVLNRLGGHDVRVMIPHHGVIHDSRYGIRLRETAPLMWNGAETLVEVSTVEREGVPIYLLRGWPFFSSDETFIYHLDEGIDAGRFLFFIGAALDLTRRLAAREGWRPDLVHIHDWHTALTSYLLERPYADDPVIGRLPTVLSIHNMMYQGWGIGWHIARAGLPPVDHPLLRAMGRSDNALAIGIAYSTMLSTVSPTYAHEITTMEGGYGLDGLVHARLQRLVGVLNGIDMIRWNPATSSAVAVPYDLDTLARRAGNKPALQAAVGLPVRPEVPLAGAVTRLVEQKGIDILIPAIRHVLGSRDMQFVVLGTGMPHFEARMLALQQEYPDRVSVQLTFNEPLSELIYAGADLFLMPSLFEPCGIGQMIAMRYGCLPLVRHVGGLADTVDADTGFTFAAYEAGALIGALWQAMDVYEGDKTSWESIQRQAMVRDFSWETSARRYLSLYEQAVALQRQYA